MVRRGRRARIGLARRGWVAALAAVLVTVGLPVVDIGVEEARADPPAPKVLLVTAGAAADALEAPLVTRLEGRGFVVQTVADEAVTAASTLGMRLVVLAPTVDSAQLSGDRLTKVSVPLVSMKAYAQDGLSMAGPVATVDYGLVSTDQVRVTLPGHPLAAGLSGTRTITTGAQNVGWVKLPAGVVGAQTVAMDSSDRPLLFAWKHGEVMFPELTAGGPEALKAHGCRVGFPAERDSASTFTPDGWALFDAAVSWTQSAACHPTRTHPVNPPARTCMTDAAPADVPETETSSGYNWPDWVDDVLYHEGAYFLAGRFTHVSNWDGSNREPRAGLAKCDASTGEVMDWDPGLDLDPVPTMVDPEVVRVLATDGVWLYAGGKFTDVRRNFARIDLGSGVVSPDWGPALRGGVHAIVVDGASIYLGGGIHEVNGDDVGDKRLIKLVRSSGDLDPTFSPPSFVTVPPPGNDPYGEPYSDSASVQAIHVEGSTLYAGGKFTKVNGVERAGVAAMDKATGTNIYPFSPDLADVNTYDPFVQVHDIFVHAGYVYLCGDWWSIEGQGQLEDPGRDELKDQQYNVGKFLSLGGTSVRVPVPEGIHSSRPWGPRTDGAVQACDIDPKSNLLYLGGHFDLTNSLPIADLAAVDLSTGELLETWDTDTTRVRGLDAVEVVPGESVAVGGTFDSTGATPQVGFAAFRVAAPGAPGGQVFPTTQKPLVGGNATPKSKQGGGSTSEKRKCVSQAADPCDTSTGNFFENFTDLVIPGRGVPLAFTRSYNSSPAPDAPTDGPLGYGWSFNYGMSLAIAGDLSSVTVNEENGAAVTFTRTGSTYGAPPRVMATLVRDGDGTWTFTRGNREISVFDPSGRLAALKDLNGYTTTLAYTGGQLTTITDPAGRTLTLGWTGGRITSVTDTASPPRSVSFAYSPAGDLVEVTDVGGGRWSFGYDANHRMTRKRAAKHHGDTTTSPAPEVTNTYDAAGRVLTQRDQLGQATTFDYTSIPAATKITDPNGNVRVDTFDQGLLISLTLGYGTPAAATWQYRYDPATLARTAILDPAGNVTTMVYDQAGNLLSSTDPLGRMTWSTHNSLDQPLTVTDAAQATTTFAYDSAGNPLSVSRPLDGSGPPVAHTTTFTYGDPARPGDVTAMTDPDGKVWSTTWDSYGNVATKTDPLGNMTRYCHDTVGRRTKVISAKGTAAGVTCTTASPTFTTIIEPDAFGTALAVTDPLGRQTVYSFDANHNPKTVTDANGNATTWVYDAADQLVEEIRPGSGGGVSPTVLFADDFTGANGAAWNSTKWATTSNDSTKTADIAANQGRLHTNGSTARGTTLMTSVADSDATFTYRFENRDARSYLRVMTRASGASGSDQMPTGYRVELRSDSATIKLQSYVNGVATDLASFPYTQDVNAQKLRVQVTGTVIRLKAWPAGTSEPAGSQIDVTDPTISAPGVFQINHNHSSGTRAVFIDDLTITGLGATAPPAGTFTDAFTGSNGSAWDAGKWATSTATPARTVDISGNEGRIWVNGTTARATAKMTPAADSEVLSTYRFSDRNATSFLRVASRASGATGADAMPTSYRVEVRSDSTTVKVHKEIGGVVTTLGTFTYPADTAPHKLRFRVAGSDLKVKLWAAAGSEPAAWAWQGTDTAITGPGVLQVVHSHTSGTRAVSLDNLTVTDLAAPPPGGGATGTKLRYDYHPDGSLWRYHDGAGRASTYGYDPLGRQTTVTDPLGRTTTYGYDLAGRLVRKQDHGGNCAATPKTGCTTMSYDDGGQLTGVDYSDPATPDVSSLTYDGLGRRTSMTDGTGTSAWAWDSLGRLTTSINGAGKIVGYGYDRRGNITTISYPGGTGTVTRTFDDTGRLRKVEDWLEHETVFNYDPNGFLTSQVYPNGSTATSTPDGAGRLTGVSHAPTATPANPFASFAYGRDNLGQVGSVISTGVPADNHTYGYTAMNQLRDDNGGTYTHDDADNLVGFPGGANLAHDAANQLTSLTGAGGTTTFAHDHRGNRTSITPPGGPATTLTYDQANRLTAHSTANATYAYSGDGLRTSRTVAGVTTDFTWDLSGGLPLLLTDGTTSYVYGPGGLPLQQITSAGTVAYYHHDQLGSTRALTNAAGAVVATYTYDPHGNQTATTGTATNPFRYAGQYTDAESGLQYLRNRYYDPATAQFLTRDPLEFQTREPYGYVGGNPLNATDPLGLFCLGDMCTPSLDEILEVAETAANIGGNIADGVALLSAPIPVVGQVVSPLAFTVGRAADTMGATATCVRWVATGARDGGDCLEGIAFAAVPNVVESVIAPARTVTRGRRTREVWDTGRAAIRGGTGVFSDLLQFAMNLDSCPEPATIRAR